MAYPILPKELQREYDNTARIYEGTIHSGHYREALIIAKSLYRKMLDWQKANNKRYHKGYPLHNIGYALYLQNENKEALKYFILAYIEDLLSADRPEEAYATPAGQTLLLGYTLNPEILVSFKKKVNELKKVNRIPNKPEEVLSELWKTEFDYKKSVEAETQKPKKHTQREFPKIETEWDKRVFIGGSGAAIINKIRDIVNELDNYDPIVVIDFNKPDDVTVYQKCLTLLQRCKYAIFDLSLPGGQIIEIERAPDYCVKILAVCQADKEHNITEVLKSCLKDRNIEYRTYTDFSELGDIFNDFLKK